MATVFREPLHNGFQQKRRSVVIDPVPNLQFSTLPVSGPSPPFKPAEASVAVPRRRNAFTWEQSAYPLYYSAAAAPVPFVPPDLPQAKRRLSIDHQALEVDLYLADVPPPFAPVDLPQPSRLRARGLHEVGLPIAQPSGPAPAPFINFDAGWPGRKRLPVIHTDSPPANYLQPATPMAPIIPSLLPERGLIKARSVNDHGLFIAPSLPILPPPANLPPGDQWMGLGRAYPSFTNRWGEVKGLPPQLIPTITIGGGICRYGGRVIIPAKKAGETVNVPFDFLSALAAGEVIQGASVTCALWRGTDSSPSAMVFGPATISGSIINQGITGGYAGNIYRLLCSAQTNLNQTIQISAYLYVETDIP